ncbi:hypothetical protein [Nocardioides sp. AE5]|uniref:hypothetical protein n=1 Tax=Nocardioides sp. AE5 TaxID=2962573 RepID=UPI002881F475|nr:hypothetical protein [Nocardioides sp. AE5]MDT0202952.1 hypothetical protein [Nocardioides sp. AE5]
MSDEDLARAIIDHAAVASSPVIELLTQGHEWRQAGISALSLGLKADVTFPSELLRAALERWQPDMGPVLADRFAKALARAAA